MSQAQPNQYAPPGSSGPSGPRAGFWIRFGAAFIDGIILGVVTGILRAMTNFSTGQALGLAIGVAYFAVLEGGVTGQTLGKKACGIRVIDFNGGGAIGPGRAIGRYFARWLSGLPLGLGYFWMLWDKEKQTWHDKLTTSVVVPVTAYPVNQPGAPTQPSA